MRAGDHQRVEGTGGAVLLGPHFLQLILLAHQHGLHHSGAVRLAAVEPADAVERGGPHIHHHLLEARAAPAGQHTHGARGARGGPENVLARQVVGVIESAGVAVVARLADARLQLDLLPVAQRRQGLPIPGVERDLCAGMRVEFQNEALALAGNRRRLDDAAAQDHDLTAFGVQLGWRPGRMQQRDQGPGREQSETAADTSQPPRQPPRPAGHREDGENAEDQEGADGPQQFRFGEWYEARNQDPRSDGSQGPEERVLQR